MRAVPGLLVALTISLCPGTRMPPALAASAGAAPGKVSWTVLGAAAGQPVLVDPAGPAVDSAGNIYAVETSRDLVVKLSPSGRLLARWGGKGSAPGRFNGPLNVALDGKGGVYISDHGNGRVQVLSAAGRPLRQWAVKDLAWVAVDGKGDVLAASGNQVLRYTHTGHLLSKWKTSGSITGLAVGPNGNVFAAIVEPGGPSENGRPSFGYDDVKTYSSSGNVLPKRPYTFMGSYVGDLTVGVARTGAIYVLDANNNSDDLVAGDLNAFSPSGSYAGHWGRRGGTLQSRLHNPLGIATDTGGNVYVADSGDGRIVKLSPRLQPLASFGTGGDGAGRFEQPLSVAVDRGGNILVADSQNSRLERLSPSGRPLNTWFTGRPGDQAGIALPNAVAVSPKGDDVYVGEYNNAVVKRFSAGGRYLGKNDNIDAPAGLAVDGAGHVFVSINDPDGLGSVVELRSDLKPLRTVVSPSKTLAHLGGLALDRAGNVYVAGPDRIIKFSPAGKLLAGWPVKHVTDVAVDRTGNLYATTHSGVELFSTQGRLLGSWGSGSAPGQFNAPQGLAIDSSGAIVVADTGNNRLQRGVAR